ncbi:MAG: 30S ribosomal protein S4 [Caldisericia bacterium]|nr:30S ribosomal protein S4 [Caldisericia bacterium]
MAKITKPKCRICRRLGVKLFLKGERCYSRKCALERKFSPPGVQGMRRKAKPSDYAIHLWEKQKLRKIYGVMERQFKLYFERANAQRKIPTGEKLLELLERRLDNVIFRGGLAVSRSSARQLVNHGHVKVNGRTVNIPSYEVKPGDIIELKTKSKNIPQVLQAIETRPFVPSWLSTDFDNLKIIVNSIPTRDQIDTPIKEELVVEFYSK